MDLRCEERIADSHGDGPAVLADPRYMKRLLLLEPLFVINEDYFTTIQSEISVEMRKVCLEWLSEIIQSEKMEPALLHLAANIMDRYLNQKKINISVLQLLAGASLMIATKLRQPNPITPAMVASSTDNAYTVNEVMMFEQFILMVLEWNVNAITVNDFLDPLLIRLPDHERIYTVTKYQAVNLVVKIVCEYDFAFWQSSHIAMGVIAAILKRMPDLESVWPHANNLPQFFHEITHIDIRTIESRIAAMEVFVSRTVQSAQEIEDVINLMNKHDDPFPGSPPSPGSPRDILQFNF